MRRMSAPQSAARESSELLVMHSFQPYHCRPWVLMPRSRMGLLFWLQMVRPHTWRCPLRATGLPGGAVPPVPHTLGTPPPPQVWGAVQVPHELTVRDWPQLSGAVTVPQFLPRREQKAASVSEVQVEMV